MTLKTKNSALQNITIILIGALLLGFLWRVRGEGGWGSSWGLLNAGVIYTLFLTVAVGERKKLNFAWTALTGLSFMLTVPSWGTLLYQISGLLFREESWTKGVSEYVLISPASGIVLMLCLGFGTAAIFGIMLGRGYSEKQWKLKDFIILLAVFYITDLVTKATVSHWLLNLLQPEAAEVFAGGLQKAEITDSVYKAYMSHFDDLSWGKKFDGGRNYFSSIQAISSTLRAVAVLLTTRFIIKDKRSANVGAVVCSAFAFAITAADIFFYLDNGGYLMKGNSYLPEGFSAWSLWEYFTGFIAGGIITAFVLKLKPQANVLEPTFGKLPLKAKNVFTFILGYIVMLGVAIVRPILERFDESDYVILFTAIAAVVAITLAVILTKKYGVSLEKLGYKKFAAAALPSLVAYIIIVYMFIGCETRQNYKSISELHNILMIVSFVAICAWSVVKIKEYKKQNY